MSFEECDCDKFAIMSKSRKSDKRRLISEDDGDTGGGGGAGAVGSGYGATGIDIGRE